MRRAALAWALVAGCTPTLPSAPSDMGAEAPPDEGDALAAFDPALDERRPAVVHREASAAGLYYLESVVGAVHVDAALPLVLVLHGLGDRPHVLEDAFYGTPDPVRIVQPRAPTPLGDGYTWLPTRVAEGRTALLSDAAAEAADRLVAFLRVVRSERPSRGLTVVTGFSQGGILAFVLAARHPEVVGTSLPVAGWLPPPLWPERPLAERLPPIHSMHGTSDRVVPLEPTRRAVAHLRQLGFAVELVELDGVHHETTPVMELTIARWLAQAVRDEWSRSAAWALAEPIPFGRPEGAAVEARAP